MGEKPWSAREATQLRAQARQYFKRHEHPPDERDDDVLDNCSACCIRGRKTLPESKGGGPNVVGWARLYVEAGEPIPSRWRHAFQRELFSANRPYAQALSRSITTFGYPCFI